ncbi:MAG: amidohydrolase family protein, partial [Anaerolineae bacterium]
WGARGRMAYPWRRLADAGATLLFGSDAPVETPDVSAGLSAATTRGGWHTEQCVSVGEALVAYTRAPAAVAGNDDVVGALIPPRRADLVVLSVDPFEVVPADLADLSIEATMIDGVWVWQRPDSDLPNQRDVEIAAEQARAAMGPGTERAMPAGAEAPTPRGGPWCTGFLRWVLPA